MVTHDYDEKRSFIRMQLETKLSFTISNDKATRHLGFSHDLSATGLLMSSDFAPAEGAQIEIMIETENARYEPFTAQGVVIRVEPDETGHADYLISVKFAVAD